jgi:hypothetical protein
LLRAIARGASVEFLARFLAEQRRSAVLSAAIDFERLTRLIPAPLGRASASIAVHVVTSFGRKEGDQCASDSPF